MKYATSTYCHKPAVLRRVGFVLGVALLLRVLIPAGYMPGNVLAGEFMVLCPESLPRQQAESMHAGHATHDGTQETVTSADSRCPIGSVLISVAPPPTFLQLTGNATSGSLATIPTTLAFKSAANTNYFSRAPPLVAS